MIPSKVKKARKQAELKACELEESLASKQSNLHKECCKEEVNFDRIVNLQDEIALLQRKITQYQLILEQMFPEGK